MATISRSSVLENKVRKALQICWDETTTENEGPKTYAFLASSFAADGKHLFEGELKLMNVMLRDAENINMYGHYVCTVYTGTKGVMVAFQPVADLEDIIEMEL